EAVSAFARNVGFLLTEPCAPVMLPLGRARLADEAHPNRIGYCVHDGRDRRYGPLCGLHVRRRSRKDDIHIEAKKLDGQSWCALHVPLCITRIDDAVLALHP